MSQQSFPISQEGYDKMLKDYEHLVKVVLPACSKRIGEALKHGDLKENAEYHAARENQSRVQERIESLRNQIAQSKIIKYAPSSTGSVVFGSTVKTIDLDDESEETFVLVGAGEASPEKGRISTASPIGKCLLGKYVNDHVEVQTPGGTLRLKILEIS